MTKERISSYTIKLKRYGTEKKKNRSMEQKLFTIFKKKKKKRTKNKNNIVYFVDS